MKKIWSFLKKYKSFKINQSFIGLSAILLTTGFLIQNFIIEKINLALIHYLPKTTTGAKSPVLDMVDYLKEVNKTTPLDPKMMEFVTETDKIRGIISAFSDVGYPPQGFAAIIMGLPPSITVAFFTFILWFFVSGFIYEKFLDINAKLFLDKDQLNILDFISQSLNNNTFEIAEMDLQNVSGENSSIKAVFRNDSLILGINFGPFQKELILYDKDTEKFVASNDLLDSYLGISICEKMYGFQNKKENVVLNKTEDISIDEKQSFSEVINNKYISSKS